MFPTTDKEVIKTVLTANGGNKVIIIIIFINIILIIIIICYYMLLGCRYKFIAPNAIMSEFGVIITGVKFTDNRGESGSPSIYTACTIHLQ